MIELKLNKDLEKVFTKIDFCYMCGCPFPSKENKTRDHIPPSSIFQNSDKSPPLILPAHENCNRGESTYDEEIGSLVGLLHGKGIDVDTSRLKVKAINIENEIEIGAVPIDFKHIIFRWVRGFHAALYNECLPADTKKAVHPPMPSGKIDRGKIYNDNILPQHYEAVEIIKKNRSVNNLDRIECRNGQCTYECVWMIRDRKWTCIFALNIYNWIDLGAEKYFTPRGCVGFYVLEKDCPNNAAEGTLLEIPILNNDRLNPFDF